MTKDEALRMALEAMELHGNQYPHMVKGYILDAIQACKEALAETQEPVAWLYYHNRMVEPLVLEFEEPDTTKQFESDVTWKKPLYTTPPSREWQSLSNEEIGRLAVFDGLHHVEIPLLAKFIIAIEAKLREKNT